MLWTVYYFNSSLGGESLSDAELKKLDANADGQFDPADILLTITDFNNQSTAEGEKSAVFIAKVEDADLSDDYDSLAYLLAEDLIVARKKK